MKDDIDATKLPGYRPEWSILSERVSPPERTIVPKRHLCGEIVQADITGESVMFFSRYHTKGEGVIITHCPLCGGKLDMDFMRALYLVEPMPTDLAIRAEGKVCSNCWGWKWKVHPVPVYDEDGFQLPEEYRLVLCEACQEETRGYVTQRYVGYAREADALNYGRALNGLIEALELEQEGQPVNVEPLKVKKTRNELLNILGF